MGREVKLAQPLVLSTDVWTPRPFDQISILRRIKFGSPPQVPKAPNAKCPKASQKLGVVDKHNHISLLQASQACIGTQSVTEDFLHSTQQQNPISNASHPSRPFPPLPQPSILLHSTPTIRPTIHPPKCPSLTNPHHPSPPSPKNSPPSSSRPSPSRPSRH